MKSKLLFNSILLFFVCFVEAQTTCMTGAMSIMSSCGSGCICNCNLTEYSWFGQMCNGSFSGGSCSTQTLSTFFSIPSGCTATLAARFSNRCNGNGCNSCGNNCGNISTCPTSASGCGASGMDDNDKLLVGGNSTTPVYTNSINIAGSPTVNTTTNASGYTITAIGKDNTGVILEYAQTGGSMFITQIANRNDEIVTFTLTIQSGCNCSNVLPVDIYSFYAIPKNGLVELKWFTKNEQHLSHYQIEKSIDGITFYPLFNIPSTNSVSEKTYTAIDDYPHIGTAYYKLTPINKSGIKEKYIIRDVIYQFEYQPFSYSLQNNELILQFDTFDTPTHFSIKDLNGKIIFQIPEITENSYKVSKSLFSSGVYIGILQNRYQTYIYKITIL